MSQFNRIGTQDFFMNLHGLNPINVHSSAPDFKVAAIIRKNDFIARFDTDKSIWGCKKIGDIHFAGSNNSISVRSDAFSDDWSFSARDLKRPEVSCEAVIWFNQGISAGVSKITVAKSTGKSEPFVLYTNKGFMGVVPDNHQETLFIFDNFSAIFSFETKFSRSSTILNTSASLIAQFDVN
jgi:hypothetical protein